MNGNACVLVRICSSLCCDCVHFVGRVSRKDVTILEYGSRVTEYEVNCAVDVAFSVELSVGMDIECVLVAFKAASVKH